MKVALTDVFVIGQGIFIPYDILPIPPTMQRNHAVVIAVWICYLGESGVRGTHVRRLKSKALGHFLGYSPNRG